MSPKVSDIFFCILWLRFSSLACSFAVGSQAFAPAPIRYAGLSTATPLLLVPRSVLDRSRFSTVPVALPQKMTLWDQSDQMRLSSNDVPHFMVNPDKTIVWTDAHLCLEASEDDEVHINRCTGEPAQLWNFSPWRLGRKNHIQLEGSKKCLAVDDRQGGTSGASIRLLECANIATEAWEFESPFSLPTRKSISSLSARHVAIFFFAMAAVSSLSFIALLWRWQKVRVLAASQGGSPKNVDQGGVCLTTTSAVMALSPLPVEADDAEKDDGKQEMVASDPASRFHRFVADTGRWLRTFKEKENDHINAAVSAAASLALVGSVMVSDPSAALAEMPAMDGAKIGTCLIKNCPSKLARCIGDPTCAANLACIQTCTGRTDEANCQITCGDKFNNDVVADFTRCAVTQKKCVPQRPDDGCWPVPASSTLVDKFSTSDMTGVWYISAGLNPSFDTFDCQRHTFEAPAPGKLVANIQWRVKDPVAGTNFVTRYTIQKFFQDETQPGILYNRNNEYLNYQDDWFILAHKPKEYVLIYYRGTNDAWDGYGGAVVYSTKPTLDKKYFDEIDQACRKAGLKFSDFQLTDNSCLAQESKLQEFESDLEFVEAKIATGAFQSTKKIINESKEVVGVVEKEAELVEKAIESEVKLVEETIEKDVKSVEETIEKDVKSVEETIEKDIRSIFNFGNSRSSARQ